MTMTPDEARAIREKFGLTQREMDERLGVGKDSYRDWERAKRDVPGPAALALRLIVALYDDGRTACRTVLNGLWRGA
jgi:DNA-binding transcriptional regulator YiaG